MMKSLLACCACLVSLSTLAQPLRQFDLANENPEVWSTKVNTTVEAIPAEASKPGGGVRVIIDPTDFSYGWLNRYFPEADYSTAAGVHGYYRAQTNGSLLGHVMIIEPEREPSYFRTELAQLADSHGEWAEFFLDFGAMRYERGPRKTFTPAQLGPESKLQFLATLGGRETAQFELAGLEILAAKDAGPLAKRMAREKLRRELLPEAETTGTHPRLLLSDAEVAALKADIAKYPELATARDRIIQLADSELRSHALDARWQAVLDFLDGKLAENQHQRRASFEGKFNPAVTPLETLGAAYRLTGNEEYGRRAVDLAVRMAKDMPVDNPLIDQGFYYTRTFYVRALAFVYDWTYDLMTLQERNEVKTTLLGFVLDIHGNSQSHGWGRRPLHRVWNWDPGLMGAAGIGMLALEGETRTGEKGILFDCRRHLRDYLTLGIDEDGCGHEGPSYIGYGIGGGVEFIEILRRQGRGDLFVDSNYDISAPWFVSETLPGGGRWNNLSDCGHGQAPWPVYTYACGRLAELAAQDKAQRGEQLPSPTTSRPLDMLAQFREFPGRRELSYENLAGLMNWVWTNGPGRNPANQYDGARCLGYLFFYRPFPALRDPAKVLPLGKHFRGRGLVVSRSGFGPEDLYLAVEAGPHVAGHDQADKGTFTLYGYGADLAIDSGYGNDGEVLKSGSAYAHNVVLVDGVGQPMRYHNQSSGHITGFHHSALLDWIRVDARDAWGIRYDGDWRPSTTTPVKRAERTFLYVRAAKGVPPYVVVMDDLIKDDQEHDYTWQWHIPADMAFETDSVPWRAAPMPIQHDVLTTAETGGGAADFVFEVAKAGDYQLAGLVRAGGKDAGKSDSFFVTVDDGNKLTWDLQTGASLGWDWVMDRGMDTASVFHLEPGTHVVHLGKREPEAELARLALLPVGSEVPLSPMEDPAGAMVLGVAEAKMKEDAFRVVKAGTVKGSNASLEVFPVRPLEGKVTSEWYETSREGSHPRLHYTVRATEPQFVMVLVPRKEGIDRPVVTPEGDWGVRVKWGDIEDMIRFSHSPEAEFGSATFLRERKGKAIAQAWLDAPRDGTNTIETWER